MTREQLIEYFTRQRIKDTDLTWAQFTSAVGAITVDERTQLLLAINNGDKDALCGSLLKIANDKKRAIAAADIDALVADNTLTVDELLTLVK